MDKILIRPVSIRSQEAETLVAELDRYQSALYPKESNYQEPLTRLEDPNVHFVGARLADAWVGIGGVRIHEPEYGELKRFFVRPNLRGRGVASAMLSALESYLIQRKIFCMRLETGIRHEAAVKFYRRRGYAARGPFGAYVFDPLCVFMEKSLAVTPGQR